MLSILISADEVLIAFYCVAILVWYISVCVCQSICLSHAWIVSSGT